MAEKILPYPLSTYIKRKITRSYAELNKALKEWYEELLKASSGKKVLYIAISRKAPRLLEWCAYKYDDKNIIVISEHALPFVNISSFDVCYVIDEAIYHGTTFQRIYNVVLDADKTKRPIAKPFVVTDDALKVNLPFDNPFKIEDNDINFFIDTIISRFHQLGKPYDMEFPLYYVTLNDKVENVITRILDSLHASELVRNKGKNIRPWYSTTTKAREDGAETTNYTFVTDYLFDNVLDKLSRPSFSKLRFHYKDDKLCIMVVAPYIINERDLVYDSPLFSGKLLSVWNRIFSSVLPSTGQSDDFISDQRRKSLVVMANYLMSCNLFMTLKDSVDAALKGYSKSEIKIENQDLRYLLGETLADELTQKLNDLSSSDAHVPVPSLLPTNPETSYIPYLYEEEYDRRLSADNLADDAGLTECISNQFSAMHWTVEIKSRRSSRLNFDRLQFGESYQSLYSRYKHHGFDRDNLFHDLHKCIDSRIDRGSVVPSYNCFSSFNTKYWLRLFRAGENEDIYRDQHFRIVGNLLRIYSHANDGDRISYGRLLLLLAMMCCEGGINPVFTTKMSIAFDENTMQYRVYAEYEDGRQIDLLDHCLNYGLLKNDDFGFLVLGDRMSEGLYDVGLPMSREYEEYLTSLSRFICRNGDDWNNDSVYSSEMINFLVYDEESMSAEITSLTSRVTQCLSKGEPFDFPSLRTGFIVLYRRIPDVKVYIDMDKNDALPEELMGKFDSVRNSKAAEQLSMISRYLYAASIFNKDQNGGDDDSYFSPVFIDSLKNSFDEDHRRYLDDVDKLHGEELRALLLKSLY